jgi:hypothetical protein
MVILFLIHNIGRACFQMLKGPVVGSISEAARVGAGSLFISVQNKPQEHILTRRIREGGHLE